MDRRYKLSTCFIGSFQAHKVQAYAYKVLWIRVFFPFLEQIEFYKQIFEMKHIFCVFCEKTQNISIATNLRIQKILTYNTNADCDKVHDEMMSHDRKKSSDINGMEQNFVTMFRIYLVCL